MHEGDGLAVRGQSGFGEVTTGHHEFEWDRHGHDCTTRHRKLDCIAMASCATVVFTSETTASEPQEVNDEPTD
jgi:hypothetical protein